MAMVGFMNVLALEGASHNIRINCLAPGAATRMIGTIPGRDDTDENAPPERAPSLVTPAVLLMCIEDAPNGKIIQASGGRFSVASVFSNDGVMLGVDADFEKVLENRDAILDMSAALEGPAYRRLK